MRFMLFSFLAVLVFFTACEPEKKEVKNKMPDFCERGGAVTCDSTWTLQPNMQAAIQPLTGIWKFNQSTIIRDGKKIQSKSSDQTFTIRYCFSPEGEIKVFRNEELFCSHCYQLEEAADKSLSIKTLNEANEFCAKQLAPGKVRIVGDSIYIDAVMEWGATEYLLTRDLVTK